MQQQYRRLRWLFALVGVSILGDTALYTVLPVYAAELGIPLVWVGVILSANRFVRLLSNPIAARLFERAGVAPVFMGGLVLAVVTTASYGLFTHVAVLVVARMLWGTAWSVLRLAGFEGVLRLVPDGDRGQWMGKFRAAYRIGSLVAALLAGVLADGLGFPAPFLIFSVAILLSTIAGWFVLSDLFAAPEAAAAAPRPSQAERSEEDVSKETAPALPASRRYGVLGIGTLAAWVAEGLVPSTLGYLVVVRYGDDVPLLGMTLGAATFTGLLLSVRWAADVVLAPATGRIADRVGVQRAGLLTFLLTALFLSLLTLPAPSWLFALLAILLLAGLAAVITLSEVLAAQTAAHAGRVRFMAAYATAADLGSAFGPLGGYVLGLGVGIVAVYQAAALALAGLGVAVRKAGEELKKMLYG